MTEEPLRVVLRDADDEAERIIDRVRRLVFRYPSAAQALFRSLVAEGRRYATTPEGQQWQQRLARSSLIRGGRVIFEVATLNALEPDSDDVLPSKVLEAVALAVRRGGLEPMLSRLFERGMGGDVDDP